MITKDKHNLNHQTCCLLDFCLMCLHTHVFVFTHSLSLTHTLSIIPARSSDVDANVTEGGDDGEVWSRFN